MTDSEIRATLNGAITSRHIVHWYTTQTPYRQYIIWPTEHDTIAYTLEQADGYCQRLLGVGVQPTRTAT